MKKKVLLFIFFKLFVVNAQNPMDIYPEFNIVPIPNNRHCLDQIVEKVETDSQGKILIYNNPLLSYIDENQILIHSFELSPLTDFVFQNDEKIIVLGGFSTFNGISVPKIFRINTATGTIDDTFNLDPSITTISGPGANSKLYIWNNKLYIKNGVFINGVLKTVVRLNLDGSLDSTFNYVGNNYVKSFFISDGRAFHYKIGNSGQIALMNSDGSIDGNFSNTNGLSFHEIINVKPAGDGGFYVLGNFTVNDVLFNRKIIKVNSNGSFNSGFAVSTNDNFYSMDIQQDYRLIAAGIPNDVPTAVKRPFFLKRLLTNGSTDPSFNVDEINIVKQSSEATRIMVQVLSDDKFYLSGSAGLTGLFLQNGKIIKNLVRFNSNGERDTTFDKSCKEFFGHSINVIEEQTDGKLLIGGFFHAYNGVETPFSLVRLHPDGDVDELFLSNLGKFNYDNELLIPVIKSIKVASDNKILVFGTFLYQDLNGETSKDFMVLNPDGTLYKSYGFINAKSTAKLGIQSDGRVILFGCNIVSVNAEVIRLDSNYDYDQTFNNISIFSTLNDFKVLPDDKFLISALFGTGSTFRRFESNGVLDSTFSPSTGNYNFDVQSNGKIILSGYDSSGLLKMSRLNSDGSLDSEFNESSYSNIRRILVKPNDHILSFTSSNIFGFDANGNPDPVVISGDFKDEGYIGYISSFKILSDGKLAVGGRFSNYDGNGVGGFVMLRGEDYYFLNGENKLDSDLNGCTDDDFNFATLKFQISNQAGSSYYFANDTGAYSLGFTAGNYTITPKLENPSYFTVTPEFVEVDFPNTISPFNQNFCIVPNGIHQDVEIILIPENDARPGFNAQYKMILRNKGNNISNGQLAFTYPSNLMSFVSSQPNPVTTQENELTWNYINLLPLETREISLNFILNTPTDTPPLNQDDVLVLTTSISPEESDENQSDNLFILNQTVINSYDPNDKTCLEGKVVSPQLIGEYVHYVIRFENNGTGNAQKVVIKDVIDSSSFDISTIIPLVGSHSFITKVDGNEISFEFENIDLPFNSEDNKGYVCFKIKLKDNLEPGNVFSNQADIYFDYNYPIITNNEITTIATLSTSDFSFHILIYPNPVKDIVNITTTDNSTIRTIELYDIQGRLLQTQLVNEITSELDLASRANGMYFVKINTDKGSKVEKLIKE